MLTRTQYQCSKVLNSSFWEKRFRNR